MDTITNFIKTEKDSYGKVFVDISYAIDNISPFLGDDIKNRKYAIKLPCLKKYIELLDSVEIETSKGGIKTLFKKDRYIDILNDYKKDNRETLSQLEKCSSCACLNCTAECKFDSCLGCRTGSEVLQCDHKNVNIVIHDNFTLNLTNNDTGEDDRYKVLATLQSIERDKKYIIIQNFRTDDKFILYYYPGIKEDTYGEITDAEEFDLVASTYQSAEE